ncbi:hypothetical protein COLO4_37458 [Corchorus olitorius]|uniref:Small acidic protein-like domain-containing protein n=1 Tax=Corchorus olitorius TaxID=93759 RepID=A0A1R3G1K4_9ROSI|nr:hypothetical protein COLO4_37458 [Corchorus olitorius]
MSQICFSFSGNALTIINLTHEIAISSDLGNSPQQDRSASPILTRIDPTNGADARQGRDRRELDTDSSRIQHSRSGDSYRYSDRRSSRSAHGYSRHDDNVRHDKHVDEDSKYDRFPSRSSRESRYSAHSDHPRQESDITRSKGYSRDADKYSRDRYDGSGHRSRDKEKESPSLDYQKYKDKDSSFERVGSGRRQGNSVSEEMDRDRRRQDRDDRDRRRQDRDDRDRRRQDRDDRGENSDSRRSLGDRKDDYTTFNEESRGHRNDSSSWRERDNDKYRYKEGYKKERIKYDEQEVNMEKDRYGRVRKEQFEEKSINDSKSLENPAKKLKLFSSGKGIDYDEAAYEKPTSLEQAEENDGRVTKGQAHSNDVDITNDLNAAKVAAMKAAELVNRNLIGAGQSNLTTEQKKKLLWGSKKSTPAEESGHHWDTALFTDRERQEKFNKLMGVKRDVKVEKKPENQDGNGAVQAEKQRELQMDLEKQYTAGLRRRDGRTVGLGL